MSTQPDAARRPVGVFDSGVGGLTVAAAIHRLLPAEDIVYLGDTARVPYGNKSPETIIRYAREDRAFLLERGVKAIVVACNTATAFALEELRKESDLPVLGVVEPGVVAAVEATRNGCVGIIGTAGTIGSGAYQRAMLAQRPDLVITARATPLLVPLIEEDFLDHRATELILSDYLGPIRDVRADTLVLACTHYPLLKPVLESLLGSDVKLVDSAENMAYALESTLAKEGLLRPDDGHEGRVEIFVTDMAAQFQGLARRFLGERVGAIEAVTLDETPVRHG